MSTGWLCESLRLTALWREPENYASALSWETVGGVPPEAREDQPRRGTSRQVGPIDEGNAVLELQTAPGRVDWILSSSLTVPTVTASLSTFPNIGSPGVALDRAEQLLFDRLAQTYSAPRFALGVVANHPTADRDASYAELTAMLSSIRPNLAGSQDFLYQINRPRKSANVSGLTINRLCRWTAVTYTGVQFTIAQTANASGGTAHGQSKSLAGTRVEVDLSSDADRTEKIQEADRILLFREFRQLALEIFDKGDVS